MKPIPVSAGQRIAKLYDYDQVIIIARKVGPDGGEHVTTYGKDPTHCAVAERTGEYLKHRIMGWPEGTCKPLAEVKKKRRQHAEQIHDIDHMSMEDD